MKNAGTKTIKTKRLTLRRFMPGDAEAIYKNWAGDPEVTEFLSWRTHNDISVTKRVLGEWLVSYAHDDSYIWAIVPDEEGTDEPVGNIAVVARNEEAYTVVIGYCLGKKYWHRGFMSEALRGVIDFFFENTDVNRIEASHDTQNPNSGGVMRKCGMVFEGIEREARKNNRGIHDCAVYSMLRREWELAREIEYYSSLPCNFDDFAETDRLCDGEIKLVCTTKNPAVPEKKYVPEYRFDIRIDDTGETAGTLSLRVGYTEGLYYGGQIGYEVDEKYRGRGYAGRACRLAARVAAFHGMEKLIITNDVNNVASRRVCEKLGARLVRRVALPEWTDLYRDGQREENIFEADVADMIKA